MKCGQVALWDSSPTGDDEESFDGSAHVIPCFDLDPMHISSVDCWCMPELIQEASEDSNAVYLHRRVQ